MRRRRSNLNDPSRREFLRTAACAAVGTSSLVSTVWDLRMMNAAVAGGLPRVQRAGANIASDYKALVCLFLYGGNDANNMIVPTTTTDYNAYSAARGILALPMTGTTGGILQLTNAALQPYATPDGRTWGIHPACPELAALFTAGKMAPVANVGTLVGPITRAQYIAKTAAVPPQLFSHNDQQVQWQTSVPDKPSRTGWGGRCADLLYSANGSNNVSMSMTLSGANTF